jgi:hypothetical protein
LTWDIRDFYLNKEPELSQTGLEKRISKVLADAGYHRPRWGAKHPTPDAYTTDSLRKWRDGCRSKTHPGHSDYDGCTRHIHDWNMQLDEALADLVDVMRRVYW